MGFLGAGKSPPPVQPPPPIPRGSDAGVMEREARERRRVQGMKGRQSTILTGAEGVKGEASVGLKSLLGE